MEAGEGQLQAVLYRGEARELPAFGFYRKRSKNPEVLGLAGTTVYRILWNSTPVNRSDRHTAREKHDNYSYRGRKTKPKKSGLQITQRTLSGFLRPYV